jgi:hypothetical protein
MSSNTGPHRGVDLPVPRPVETVKMLPVVGGVERVDVLGRPGGQSLSYLRSNVAP